MSQTQLGPPQSSTEAQTQVSSAPVSQEPEKEERSSERDYIVFVEGQNETWKLLSTVTAGSAEQAIKSIQDLKETRYAAVPVRNWTVGKPKIQQVTQVSLELE